MTPSLSSTEQNGIEAYYTNTEGLLAAFRALVAAPKLSKRILFIHGVGGVGKSSLLRMFRLHSKSVHVPTALVSGDDAKSVVEILRYWAEDLKADGVALPTFAKTYDRYRAMLAKLDERAKKTNKFADMAGKAASKTAEATGGALAGAAIGSIVPGLGTVIGGAVGGIVASMSAEALVDWLRGQGLSRSDIDLVLDPATALTSDFLGDAAKMAQKQRIVLILDTFEQMATLNSWACRFCQRLHPNALVVIAGREMLDWDKQWEGWLAQVEAYPLEPMTPEVMRTLARRYYATMVGGEPDPKQVEAIISFARGLPMVVTSAVRLWVKYRQDFDFEGVKAEVIGDLVERLREGVPAPVIPVLEAAAAARWFDQPILRAVTGLSDVNAAYDELRRFPFVRSSKQGLRLHDSVREILDESLRMHDAERYCELHERAAEYLEAQQAKHAGDEAELYGLERLYHHILADEETGIKLFQEMAEGLVAYEMKSRLNTLLNDVNTYPLAHERGRLWRKYYHAQLLGFDGQLHLAEIKAIYQEILAARGSQDSYLRAKALLGLATILERDEEYMLPGVPQHVMAILEECERLLPPQDREWHLVLIRRAYRHGRASFAELHASLLRIAALCRERNDPYALASTVQWIKGTCAMHGRWKEFLEIERETASTPSIGANAMLRARAFSGWQLARIWMGRYAEAESILKQVEETQYPGGRAERGDAVSSVLGANRDLLYAIFAQRRMGEARPILEKMSARFRSLGDQATFELMWVLRLWGIASYCDGDYQQAKDCLSESSQIADALLIDPYQVREERYWLGWCCLARQEWQEAEGCFARYVALPFDDWNLYFKCGALTGLARIRQAQGKRDEILPLIESAEQLAQQHEYNDHLASLKLMQGHLTWQLGGVKEQEVSESLKDYQQALIYALRYNRFMLDEVLWGDSVVTPLRPIIPQLLERGDEGRRMLVALRDWWGTGKNDSGTPRPDTISLIPEGIALLEAERIARAGEPGDGAVQKSVVEQIGAALRSQ